MNKDQWEKRQKERIKLYEEMAKDYQRQAKVCSLLAAPMVAQKKIC